MKIYTTILYCMNFQDYAYIWMINLMSTPTNAIILLMDVQTNGTTTTMDMNVNITVCTIIHVEICRFAKMKYVF